MLKRHVARCLIAGFVALLPVGGLVLTIVYLEQVLAESWLARQWFYLPGLGLVAATVTLYLIGLLVTTFIGRWMWSMVDRVLLSLPFFGSLYATLKQVLGYDTGEGAIFREAVLVTNPETGGEQLGLVTEQIGEGDAKRTVVFVPEAPNPVGGRLVFLTEDCVQRIEMPVDDVLKALVSLGKTNLPQRFVAPLSGQ